MGRAALGQCTLEEKAIELDQSEDEIPGKGLKHAIICNGCGDMSFVNVGIGPIPPVCVACWQDVLDDPTDFESLKICARVAAKMLRKHIGNVTSDFRGDTQQTPEFD